MNKLSKKLNEIIKSGYDHTQVLVEIKGLKAHQYATVCIPKFMYPNQIKREFPNAVSWTYFGIITIRNKKGKYKGMDYIMHDFVGQFE